MYMAGGREREGENGRERTGGREREGESGVREREGENGIFEREGVRISYLFGRERTFFSP